MGCGRVFPRLPSARRPMSHLWLPVTRCGFGAVFPYSSLPLRKEHGISSTTSITSAVTSRDAFAARQEAHPAKALRATSKLRNHAARGPPAGVRHGPARAAVAGNTADRSILHDLEPPRAARRAGPRHGVKAPARRHRRDTVTHRPRSRPTKPPPPP
jgi:hypothetical protein